MTGVIGHLAVDAGNPPALARWWAQVLDWAVEDDDEQDEVWIEDPEGGSPGILFIRVPDAKSVKNRLHLDLRPADGTDQTTELQRLVGLGATHVDIGQGDVSWYVLADPEGNEFCLLSKTPAQVAASDG